MKIAVIKLGARITWDTDGAVAPGEAVSICKALTRGGADVHVYTKILAKDTLDASITWHNILDDKHIDADLLLIINGNVNFFGGAEDKSQIANYQLLNAFKGPAVYVMCDPELPFMQIWDSVNGKQEKWGSSYKESEILVTKPNIHLLSQPFNTEEVEKGWPAKAVKVASTFHFPMDRFPLLNASLPIIEPQVDLMYGGTARGGRRIPKLYEWYCGLPDDISVEIFGSVDETDFQKHNKIGKLPVQRYPTFTGKVKYDQVLPKMNTSLAHLVAGDPSYEVLDIIPQRVAECFAAGNLVFVDAAMDKSRRIYPRGRVAGEFLYVETQAELVDRLRIVKREPELRGMLLNEQAIATEFDPDTFCQSLITKLKAL